MPLLDDETSAAVAARLEALAGPVTLHFFAAAEVNDPDGISGDIRALLHEVSELNPRLTVAEHDFHDEAGERQRLDILRTPAIALEGASDFGLRYYGAPAGHEFATLLEAIIDVGRGAVDLPEALRARLATLTEPVHIQVFSTPT